MRLNINTAAKVTAAIIALGIGFAPDARACTTRPGGTALAGASLFAALLESQTPPSLKEAQAEAPGNQNQEVDRPEHRRAPVVGMWTVTFYVGTTSELYDLAIEQFYADGNEMTTDIAAAPVTDNTCYGVWAQTASRTFKLRHFGWVFDTNGTFIGRFELTATLDVSNRNDTFSGTYVADQKDLSGNIIPALHAEGALKATRFTIN